MTEAERVNAAWDRIEKWYCQNMPDYELRPGASTENIQDLEAHLDVILPDGFKASLLRHDGFEDGKWPKYSWLLSTEEIKEEWDMRNEIIADKEEGKEEEEKEERGEDENEGNEGKLHPGYWCLSWVPIDADEGQNGSCVDLKPGPNGKLGQVIDFYYELGPSGPNFESYMEYLEDIAMELEAGKHKNDGGYVKKVDEDDIV